MVWSWFDRNGCIRKLQHLSMTLTGGLSTLPQPGANTRLVCVVVED